MKLIKEIKVQENGLTMLLSQYHTSPYDSYEWKKGPTIRRLRYETKLGLHEWVGLEEDRPDWWQSVEVTA